jgi:membrane-associated phospholipid phosphatase
MTGILDQGIDAIVWLQRFSPMLDWPFRCLTFLGDKEFALIVLPFLYWCLDRRVGARLTIFFLISAYINAAAKVLGNQPRPFEYSDRVRCIAPAGGHGFPSGHTQSTVLIWGYLAACFRRFWLWGLAVALMFLVPLSRLYLGVHFPTDLVGGYWLGAMMLFIAIGPALRLEAWLCQCNPWWQLAAAVLLPMGLMTLFPGKTGVTAMATLTGFGVGLIAESRWVGFECDGDWRRRGLRFLLGGIVLFILWAGLARVFASLEPKWLFRFIRYALTGLWTAWGAPWAFVRLGLAGMRLGEVRDKGHLVGLKSGDVAPGQVPHRSKSTR